jgi:hypothetical protein
MRASVRSILFTTLLACGVIAPLGPRAWAQSSTATATAPTERVRGTVLALTATSMTVRDRSGEVIELALPESATVQEVYPIALADIRPGSYIGTAAMPQPDGTQRAIAVTVFPEAARGTGEGHRPFDLQPQSTMTNATVAEVVASADGRRLTLRHKGGEVTVVVPEGAPVVTSAPSDRRALAVGASVSMAARLEGGRPTALRINVGRNGYALPY